MLDLGAIGTIADMMSLKDENRILVKFGLEILKNTERVGLEALLKVAGMRSSDITEETIGFQIAPRLNALGRIDDPNPAIELLTGWDEDETRQIAEMIDQKNVERKAIIWYEMMQERLKVSWMIVQFSLFIRRVGILACLGLSQDNYFKKQVSRLLCCQKKMAF